MQALHDEDSEGFLAREAAYLQALLSKGYSKNSVKGYDHYLRKFRRWCIERGLTRPTEVTRSTVELYQRYLFEYRTKSGYPLSAQTQYSALSTLKVFYRWLSRQNMVVFNPVADMDMPRRPKLLPRNVLSAAEVEKVLSLADINDPIGLRDRAMMETLYSTGMRRSELGGLCIYDVDMTRGTVMIREGKGNKDRVVPIGERAVGWINKYLADVRPKLLARDDEKTLFLTRDGVPVTVDHLSGIVKVYVDRAELGKTGACHMLRHSMATLMLENGADIRFIQAMLGHTNLTTTEIYTRVSVGKLKEIHNATHPGARNERRVSAEELALDDNDD
jgi:integrase/recombinase XerD